jgi:predicted RNA binding protein YcfA (HicA-like mRNA interferase family)
MERQRSHRVLRHPSGATVVVGTTPGSAKAVTTARTKIENIEANLAGESR